MVLQIDTDKQVMVYSIRPHPEVIRIRLRSLQYGGGGRSSCIRFLASVTPSGEIIPASWRNVFFWCMFFLVLSVSFMFVSKTFLQIDAKRGQMIPKRC
jgi:hypothetical protein